MQAHVNTVINDPDDAIRAYMGGTSRDIPIIEFGDDLADHASITLRRTLTPAQQALWLERLSVAADDLAKQAAKVGVES